MSWSGVLYAFSFPDEPENYELLEKIGQLPEPQEFSSRKPPEGVETLSAISLHSKFLALDQDSIDVLNSELRRRFIGGLEEADLIYYVKGSYTVQEVRDLTEDDFVTSGLAIRTQAVIQVDEYRDPSHYPLYLEIILPNAKSAQKIFYPIDGTLELERVPSCVAIVHAARQLVAGERSVIITAMPITQGTQITAEGSRIRTSLPEKYNLDASPALFTYE